MSISAMAIRGFAVVPDVRPRPHVGVCRPGALIYTGLASGRSGAGLRVPDPRTIGAMTKRTRAAHEAATLAPAFAPRPPRRVQLRKADDRADSEARLH